MSEEPTKNFEGEESFESRVLAGLAGLRNSMENRFATLENRFATLENRFATLENRFTALETRFETLETRFETLEGRVTSLELKVDALGEKVDARLRETRPIWEAVLTRLDIIESKVEGLALNLLDVRGEVERLKRRLPPLPPAA
jgi:chaperonin cofactor prefoldin